MSTTNPQKTLAIFASGTGSNTQKIIDYFRNHPRIRTGLIVSNNARAGVLQIAEKEGIPEIVIDRQKFAQDGYLDQLLYYKTDWIILAGFLWKIPRCLIGAFPSRIINIHPALLPSYGGKGMYGMHVHQAVIDAHEPKSGITIHYVDEHYDNGKIILQQDVLLAHNETPESLATKIHQLEHRYFAPTIEKLVMNG